MRSLAEITGTGVGWVHDSQTLLITRHSGQAAPAQVTTTSAPDALLEDWPAAVTAPPVVQTTIPVVSDLVVAPPVVADVPPVSVPVVTVPSPVVLPVAPVLVPPVTPLPASSRIVRLTAQANSLWTTVEITCASDVYSVTLNGEHMTYKGNDTFVYHLINANTGRAQTLQVFDVDGRRLESVQRNI